MQTITTFPAQTPVKAMCIIAGEVEWIYGLVKRDFDDCGHIWYSILTVVNGRVTTVAAHEEDVFALDI